MSDFFIPYGRQNIDSDDIQEVIKTLKSDFLTQGPKVLEFEKKFADYIGSKYAVAVNNATAALHISVICMGLKKGDRVITTPITFASTANCVRFCGGEVWFADIDSDTYTLSIESTKELINSKPPGYFKGIIPVDFGGLPVQMDKFRNLADENGLWLIEDSCHAPGAYFFDEKNNKQMCGNGKYADVGVFSFHPVKHIACGEGGMITTNSKKIYKKALMLRTHGISKENMSENHGNWYYEMKELGYNYRLTDIQAALGISQLKKNIKGVLRRNEISQIYKASFEKLIKFQKVPQNMNNAYHLFIIEVERRKELYDFLRTKKILSQIHYIPIHSLPYYKKIGYEGADLKNAELYYSRCLSLPMYPTLNNDDINYIINNVLEFCND